MKRLFLMLTAVLAACGSSNRLPDDAVDALRSAQAGVLYSLEPWSEPELPGPKLEGFAVLGKTELTGKAFLSAVNEFETAVVESNGETAACFDPRHALEVVSKGRRYRLLLCYACQQMAIFRDGERIAMLSASGSAKTLNGLLTAVNVPVSTSYDEDEALHRAQQHQMDFERWRAATPKSIVSFMRWDDVMFGMLPDDDIAKMRGALNNAMPSANERILALYQWNGSGAGPWSGFPSYESVAEQLLLTHTTDELLAALDAAVLTEGQVEGAARLFGGWDMSQDRPDDIKRLSPAWKAKFLEQALKSSDEDKQGRARDAFQEP